MNLSVPSQNEEHLCRFRALYLGTSLLKAKSSCFDETKFTLDTLQDTMGERYPIDGSNFTKGIETWLSIFPNGIQMEHSSASDMESISALFYYPIKSLIYCGALRFTHDTKQLDNKNSKNWKFLPLDNELSNVDDNAKNPPLFVVFLKGIDPSTKKQIIECSVFVVATKNTAMKLVESCQKSYRISKITMHDFFKKYANIPVVFCSKDELVDKNEKRVLVKMYDVGGYFYATETTSIDLWQLFELNQPLIHENSSIKDLNKIENKNEQKLDVYSLPHIMNPYERTSNLVSVEKRVDPVTGQNIYVRYLSDHSNTSINYNKSEKLDYDLYSSQKFDEDFPFKKPPILIREEKTPSPIIYEKYIKKKAPQVIVKEIHVQEPTPNPIKIIQADNNSNNNVYNPNINNSYNQNKTNVPIVPIRRQIKRDPEPKQQPMPLPVPIYSRGEQTNASTKIDFRKVYDSFHGQNPYSDYNKYATGPVPVNYNYDYYKQSNYYGNNVNPYNCSTQNNNYYPFNGTSINYSAYSKNTVKNVPGVYSQYYNKHKTNNLENKNPQRNKTQIYQINKPSKEEKLKQTYDLIENVRNILDKNQNNSNHIVKNGRKIYVLHEDKKDTKRKVNRKIIVIEEP